MFGCIPFQQLEVFHGEGGAPQFRVVGVAAHEQAVFISLSHDGDIAGAIMSRGQLGG